MSNFKAYRCKYCKKCYYTAKDLGEHKKANHPEIVLTSSRSVASSFVTATPASSSAKQSTEAGLHKEASDHVLQQLQSNEPAALLPDVPYDSTEQTGYEISLDDHQDSASAPLAARTDTVTASVNERNPSRKPKRSAPSSEDLPRPLKKGRRTKPVESIRLSENVTKAATRARKPARPKSPARSSREKTSCETCGLAFRSTEYRRHADICRRNLNKFSNNMSRFIRFFRSYESANLN